MFPTSKKICYNQDKDVLRKYKYLLPLVIQDTSIYEKSFEDDLEMKEVLDKMENFSSNKEEWVTFRDENEYEETYQRGIEIAKEEGETQKEAEIVKNMLKEKMDISLISKITTLPEEEILQIKNEGK